MKKPKRRLKKSIKFLLFLIIFSVTIFFVCRYYYFHQDKIPYKIANIILPYTPYSVYPDKIDSIKVHTDLIKKGKARPGTIRKIKYIVIHETDNYAASATAKSHAYYLKNNNDTSTSWHYTVDEKEIYHHIPDNEIAHHAGERNGNIYGIGIEMCVNEGSDYDKTVDNTARLVAYLLKEYHLDIDSVKMHKDFSGKECPHYMLKNNGFKAFKKKVGKYYG